MTIQASAAQRAKLAQETRKRFVADLGQVMLELAAAVQERLTALMNEAAPSREMQSRRDAWTFYLTRRVVWQEGTLKAWQVSLQPTVVKPAPSLDGSFELVATEVADNQIVASRLVMGLTEKISAELNDLLLRIKYLESTQVSEGPEILQPDVVVLVMVEQWVLTGMPIDAWAMVNELVLKLLAERLQKAYVKANEFLIKLGVLPSIELKDRVKRVTLAAPRGGVSRSAVTGQASEERRNEPNSLKGGFEANHASQGDQGRTMPGVGAGNRSEWSHNMGSVGRQNSGFSSASDEPQMMTGNSPMARARSRAQGMLGQLKRFLMGAGGAEFEPTHFQPPSPALAAALVMPSQSGGSYSGSDTVLEDYTPAAVARVAGDLRRRTIDLKNKAETKSEKATIEIVALMFQAILQEDRIPPGIRVWFARLQMPVLRVALSEPDFFGTLNHPARQLIDRMGSCVMGFDASGIKGNALELEVKRVVQVIEQYPETGKRVFQLVYDEFQKFLAQFLTGSASTQKMVSVAQLVEEKETLTIQYTIEMRNMLKDMPVSDPIREFLFKVWAEVLAVAAVRKGPQHVETLGFKKAATDLVWAASAKPNRTDRARVIQDLPKLLQQLRAGMALLGVAPSDQEGHIKTVSDTLADAFLSKTQSISTEQISLMAERLTHLEDFVSEDGVGDLLLDAQSIEAMLGLDATMIDVVADGGAQPSVAMLAWAQELEVGSWFTLDHNSRVAQVQFVWQSDRKQLNLFAATTGHSYLIQAGRLAAYLQAGLLVPQEAESLTVRATRDALIKLQANPERLLG